MPDDEYAVSFMSNLKETDEVEMWSKIDLRTREQNNKMWPMLHDFEKQIPWDGELITAKEWKILISALFDREVKLLRGLEGGVVMVPSDTSDYLKKKFSDFIEFVYVVGNGKGVEWSEKALEAYEKYREAQ